jgi:pilus assembly protein CpaB
VADSTDKSKGMPSNRRKILFVSFGLAVLAVLLLYIYTQQLAAKYGVAGEKVSLVAAKYDIPEDKPITHDMLMQLEVPESYVHPQSVYLNEWERITGQRTGHTIRAGQVLLWTDFADPRTDVQLDQVVKEGWRALAIPVDRTSSLGGLLAPNDHVDILGTFMKPETRSWITLTLLQNVTVLAVGAQLGSDMRAIDDETKKRGFQTVTVLVTPEEAELLTFSIDKGKITLSLRNENDITTEVALPPKDFQDIFGEKKRNTIQKKRNDTITIIR